MYTLPDLPYAYEALEPTISANTLKFHHDKHHAAYVTALNGLLNGDDQGSLENVIKSAGPGKVFNNAAQAWNHAFFWDGLSPTKTAPGADLAAAIESRSEERRVGKECRRLCRSRWSPYH
jgi:Fe-Mn family superoxide dismutase